MALDERQKRLLRWHGMTLDPGQRAAKTRLDKYLPKGKTPKELGMPVRVPQTRPARLLVPPPPNLIPMPNGRTPYEIRSGNRVFRGRI